MVVISLFLRWNCSCLNEVIKARKYVIVKHIEVVFLGHEFFKVGAQVLLVCVFIKSTEEFYVLFFLQLMFWF